MWFKKNVLGIRTASVLFDSSPRTNNWIIVLLLIYKLTTHRWGLLDRLVYKSIWIEIRSWGFSWYKNNLHSSSYHGNIFLFEIDFMWWKLVIKNEFGLLLCPLCDWLFFLSKNFVQIHAHNIYICLFDLISKAIHPKLDKVSADYDANELWSLFTGLLPLPPTSSQ